MRVIGAGSRTIKDRAKVEEAIADSGFDITSLLCGMASGVDTIGKEWAISNGVPFDRFPPCYHGDVSPRLAPKLRNWLMAANAEALIAVWDGFSGGTAHMIAAAVCLKISVFVFKVPEK